MRIQALEERHIATDAGVLATLFDGCDRRTVSREWSHTVDG